MKPSQHATFAAATATPAWWGFQRCVSEPVRRWSPSSLSGRPVGELWVRSAGVGDRVVVLLHGRTRFAPNDHVDALDEMLGLLGLDGRPLIIGAHSMGAALALRWAGRLGDQVERNTAWARVACRWNCSHRSLAGWVAAVLAPSIPVPIARAASLHSWPAYRDAMDCLIGGTDWSNLAGKVTASGASLKLVWGDSDRIGDGGFAASLIGAELESSKALATIYR